MAILLLIILSSIKLAIDSYISEGSEIYKTLKSVDIVFTTFFLFEFMMKVIAIGFIMDNNSYLRDSWNQLDFIIVMFSLIELASEINSRLNSEVK